MRISAPKFEAVFNNNGEFFRLLQDAFHPQEYVDDLIGEIYKRDGFVTYIIDDALIHYMKMSFKRLRDGRRQKFPNYKIVGLSRSGFTPYDVPQSKVGTVQSFEARIHGSSVICGSTQLKRKMVLCSMLEFKRKYNVRELLFFVAYSDDVLAEFAMSFNAPMALMAADMVGRMPEYFGPWHDWYYLRCSQQHKADLALVNSRTCELHVPSAYSRGVGDSSFFKIDADIEDWIAANTSLTSGQAKNINVGPDTTSDVEVLLDDYWRPTKDVDINWGGLGRGREDSFGLCSSTVDFGPTVVLRVKTAIAGVYFCGFFMQYAASSACSEYRYTPLPVKNQTTLKDINDHNGMRFM